MGKFRIYKSYLCLCHRYVYVHIKIENEKFFMSYQHNFTKSLLILNCHDIICVNKRPIFKTELNTFSIYYKDPNIINGVKELKLKADSRREVSDWIDLLRRKLSLNRKYEFTMNKTEEKKIEPFLKKFYNFHPKKFFFQVYKMDKYLTTRIKFLFLKNLVDRLVILKTETINKNASCGENDYEEKNGMTSEQTSLINNDVAEWSDRDETKKISEINKPPSQPILNKLTDNIIKNSIDKV